METRSIFRLTPGTSIPLLPLHASPSRNPPSPYQTAPQSPELPPGPRPTPAPPQHAFPEPKPRAMTSPTAVRTPAYSDAQKSLHRQQTHLEAQLQNLLDTQSEGLLAGLGGAPPLHDDRFSTTARSPSRSTTSASTPTSNTRSHITWAPPPSNERVVPVRQPKPKKIGLKSARRGISRTMVDLAVLKTQEAQVLEAEIEKRDDVLALVQRIEEKEAGLRAQIQKIEAGSDNERLKGMQMEERAVDGEIREVELRLSEMRSRQRVLRGEIQAMENGVQAKLSSYKNALRLAEREAKEFLARPPLETDRRAVSKTGLWAMPNERRTLEMVRENYMDESESLKKQTKGVQEETEALEEGGKAWGDVVAEVTRLEEALREEMGKPQAGGREGMQMILVRMTEVKDRLEEKLRVAEERRWNLLVAAIGAEVEALTEGRGFLEEALREVTARTEEVDLIGVDGDNGRGYTGRNDLEELENGEKSNGGNVLVDRSEDEDEGPGADLLIEEDGES